jgi:transcriptional regulator with XRE-family HTH domain
MITPEKITPAQLAEIAQRLSLSTQSLADYLGVPVHTLIKWQNGTRTPPAVAARLLAVLAIVEALAPELHRAALLPPAPVAKPATPRRRAAADPTPEVQG